MNEICLSGTLDVSRARELHSIALQLAEAGTDVAIDCTEVCRMDTSAVQILAALRIALERTGNSCAVVNLQPDVREHLTTVGLITAISEDPKR